MKNKSLSLDEGYEFNCHQIVQNFNMIDFDNKKIFNPKGVDFYSIQNKKICDLDLTQFNTEENKYTIKRSTLIEFLKDDIYTQHLRSEKG